MMPITPTRRRFVQISAAALALCATSGRAAAPMAHWTGIAMGAGASMTLAGIDQSAAAPVFAAMEVEIARLESIFSLYRPDSELVRLNAAGHLTAPSADLLNVLSLSQSVWAASGRVFDPTVQPLWMAMAKGEDSGTQDQARALVGWQHLRWDVGEVRLTRPGMALTFNGVAQGYITDKIAALLGAQGFGDILVDMGEIAARGHHGSGRPWRAGIAAPDGRLVRHLHLTDRAIATSAPMGTVLDADGRRGHILDPGRTATLVQTQLCTVSAPRAAMADALSTACCLLPAAKARAMVGAMPGAILEHYS